MQLSYFLLEFGVLEHERGGHVVLGELGVLRTGPISVYRRPNKNIFQILQLRIKRVILEHNVFIIFLPQILLEPQLLVLLSQSSNLEFEFLEHPAPNVASLRWLVELAAHVLLALVPRIETLLLLLHGSTLSFIYSLNSASLIKMTLAADSLRTLTSRSTRPDWRQHQLLPARIKLAFISLHALLQLKTSRKLDWLSAV